MPEGPTVKYFSRKLKRFAGKTVTEASGYGPMDKSALENIPLKEVETFGKNLIFVFKDFFVTAHFGLFGSMLVNDRKKVNASFALHFSEDEVNFYVTNTRLYTGKPQDHFNFKTDILKPEFDADFILTELKESYKDQMIGDVLMDQNIFAGVGNIIRVETLYHAKIHPESLIKDIPEKKIQFLLKMVVDYAEEFLDLMKTGTVKTAALVYGKKACPKHKTELYIAEMGKVKRKTYVCLKCQKLYI